MRIPGQIAALMSFSLLFLMALACSLNAPTPMLTPVPVTVSIGVPSTASASPSAHVPHDTRWGIYTLNLAMQEVELLYGAPNEIACLRLNAAGDRFAFSQKADGNTNEDSEIFTLGTDGRDLQRLTDNRFSDTYPAWSPDGSEIAFLSWPGATLDIYLVEAAGGQARQLYDSGAHDADIDWVNNLIAFTRNSQIWIMNADGSGAHQLTDPPRAGEWGNANLPFGDYDPKISPDGSRVVFERMVDDKSPHGNYDLYLVDIDGSNITRLTDTGYTQGLANWSHSGSQIVYIVAAVDGVGQYDIYVTSPDGTENRNITPAAFPAQFLSHWAIFANDDTILYFIGEWWSEK